MGSRAKGFTLVELAIVLVIIGIIIGALLKGQEMIFNAKVKRTVSLIKELMAAVYTYYDRYGYLPGDDPTASQRWGRNAPDGNGDGIVCYQFWDCAAGNQSRDEYKYLIRHLRYANFISGDPNEVNPWIPVPFGSTRLGVVNAIHIATWTDTGSPHYGKLVAHVLAIPGEASEAIDRIMDDGNCTTGSLMAFDATVERWCNGTYSRDHSYDLHVFF